MTDTGTDSEKSQIKPPLTQLSIPTADSGFYTGFNKHVTITSKIIISVLIVWAIAFPVHAAESLGIANDTIIHAFSGWYIYLAGLFLVLCLVLAIVPQSGRLKLGHDDEKPEFSRFSWFAMMFGSGIGIGMLTYSTGEPLSHLQTNPEIITGQVEAVTAQAVPSAYIYSFLHWGFTAWAIYAVVGLAVGYISYRRDLPLTIRSGLMPLFGTRLAGGLGNIIDIFAVIATILGIAVTLGLGVDQLVQGLNRIGFGDWLLNAEGEASVPAIIFALVIVVGASTLSAISGVGKGIKWLSNLNLLLSFALFAAFLVLGAAWFCLTVFGQGLVDYVMDLPRLSIEKFSPDGTIVGDELAKWQLDWSVFYWAWWIAFAPFVGMFIARVSRGRTLREYVLGVILAPSIMCFIWLALVGGTAIDLVLNDPAGASILAAKQSDQLFATMAVLMDPYLTFAFSVLVVVLLLTYVVTSADSAILIVNTINAAGNDSGHGRRHILFWGSAIALVVGSLLIVGGLDAVRTAMIIGALPFSFVAALMAIAIGKAIWLDIIRLRNGVPCTVKADPGRG